jgi:hypothetical protein
LSWEFIEKGIFRGSIEPKPSRFLLRPFEPLDTERIRNLCERVIKTLLKDVKSCKNPKLIETLKHKSLKTFYLVAF